MTFRRWFRFLPVLLAGALRVSAQPAALTPAAPPAVNSPEVHADRRVTFRLRAPNVKQATFFGDWMKTGDATPMTKSADGVWSVTVGPLDPSIYLYTFTVDGLTIADPVNPRIKLRSQTSASMVEVPPAAPETEMWQPRDVPHGAVEINWVKANALGGDTRWFWVYTPPGYEKSGGRRYPVLYLFHGSNDIAGGWTLAGQMNFILDNLIAAKKAEPMVVVMPYGHAVPFGSPREVQATNTQKFEEHLLQDVMPAVNTKYRVKPGREARAIAGLSMGGGQSLSIGWRHPELFSAIGAFSAAIPQDAESLFKTDWKPSVFWFACGRADFLFERNQKFDELLKAKGIRHTWRETEGNHTYTVWRKYLAEFAPLLFRKAT